MNANPPMVLSRTAITIVSLVVALPLAAWPLLYLPANNGLVQAVHWCFENIVVRFAACLPLLLLVIVVSEIIIRRNRFVGLRRLPWISFFLVPGIVLCLLALFITHAMSVSGLAPYPGIWSIAALLFFQIVGHVSLAQRVDDDSKLLATESNPG